MSDLLKPGLGTFLSIESNLPATNDATGYGALAAFDEVGELTDVPEFGPSHDTVSHVPLKTGITAKYHGALNYGSVTLPMGLSPTDAGQIALKAALANKARHAFSVEYADGAIDYFQGKVMSFTRGASIGSVVQASVTIEIETAIVEVAAP